MYICVHNNPRHLRRRGRRGSLTLPPPLPAEVAGVATGLNLCTKQNLRDFFVAKVFF